MRGLLSAGSPRDEDEKPQQERQKEEGKEEEEREKLKGLCGQVNRGRKKGRRYLICLSCAGLFFYLLLCYHTLL